LRIALAGHSRETVVDKAAIFSGRPAMVDNAFLNLARRPSSVLDISKDLEELNVLNFNEKVRRSDHLMISRLWQVGMPIGQKQFTRP
jgi:hypothetical protein